MHDPKEMTQILNRLTGGDRDAFDQLFPLVYEELRAVARRQMRRERANHTLQATALMHEAYLRLIDAAETKWENRAHFFAIAARAMRQILIEHARSRGRKKRGGGWERISLGPTGIGAEENPIDLIALDLAVTKLEESDPRKARVVELLFFGGLTAQEAGEVLGVTSRTVERDWRVARLLLLREMLGPGFPASDAGGGGDA